MKLLHSLLRDRLLLETDKRKALASTSLAIPTHIHAGYTPEGAEEIPKVVFLRVLRDVRDTQCGEVVARG